MELLATIDSSHHRVNQIPKRGKPFRQTRKSTAYPPFRLGKLANTCAAFTPREDGELIAFVNEPKGAGKYYDNNTGTLTLTVELVAEKPCVKQPADLNTQKH